MRETAAGLIALGLRPGERVAAPVVNRSETVLVELAVQAARGSFTALYPTLTEDQQGDLVALASARMVVAEDADALCADRPRAPPRTAPRRRCGSLSPAPASTPARWTSSRCGRSAARAPPPNSPSASSSSIPRTRRFFLFTFETTGGPGRAAPTVPCVVDAGQFGAAYPQLFRAGYWNLSYLPLSHIAEQLASVVAPLEVGGTASSAAAWTRCATTCSRRVPPASSASRGSGRRLEAVIAAFVGGARNPRPAPRLGARPSSPPCARVRGRRDPRGPRGAAPTGSCSAASAPRSASTGSAR